MGLFVVGDAKPGSGPDSVQEWTKSSFSWQNGNCVEVAGLSADLVKVRDSMNPDGTVLRFGPAEWAAFVGGVRKGEFDRR
jgi:hypothetical protein